MSKGTLVSAGAGILLIGILVPLLAITGTKAEETEVTADIPVAIAESSFQENCGYCHAMSAAGTNGDVGPDLDALLGTSPPEANFQRVLNAVENGISGRMPARIVQGQEAEQVSRYVAEAASRIAPPPEAGGDGQGG